MRVREAGVRCGEQEAGLLGSGGWGSSSQPLESGERVTFLGLVTMDLCGDMNFFFHS